MYTYDPETGTIRCASCIPTGTPPTIMRFEPPGFRAINTTSDVLASQSGPFMSDDGRVAFATSDALVPQDTDGIERRLRVRRQPPPADHVGNEPALRRRGRRDLLSARIHRARVVQPQRSRSLLLDLRHPGSAGPQRHRSSSSTTPAPTAASRSRRRCCRASRRTSAMGPAARRPTPQVGTGANLATGGNEQPAPSKKAKKAGARGSEAADEVPQAQARHRHRHAAGSESRNG